MTQRATRESWKCEPMGDQRVRLPLSFTLDKAEMDVVSMGVIPEEMENKWFIFLEEGHLHIHRSWTGFEIYEIRFECENGKHIARDVWVTRDPERYQAPDDPQYDIKQIIEQMRWRFGIEVAPIEP